MSFLATKRFTLNDIQMVNRAVLIAEELVSNFFKMSANQWLRPKYDVKTLVQLGQNEIVEGPFAQIIRYEGKRTGSSLGSDSYDFYKICLQDHTIIKTLESNPLLSLFPICLYIITHELVHIVRFSKFLQIFDASAAEKLAEEKRVHTITNNILTPVRQNGLNIVLDYFKQWRLPIEDLENQ
ncbi:MAG: hypothetical protein GY874_01340 [Desulfobacteraceae bacterium]|nr:hypothetical protein [Desulfobacteraceae bacterium]